MLPPAGPTMKDVSEEAKEARLAYLNARKTAAEAVAPQLYQASVEAKRSELRAREASKREWESRMEATAELAARVGDAQGREERGRHKKAKKERKEKRRRSGSASSESSWSRSRDRKKHKHHHKKSKKSKRKHASRSRSRSRSRSAERRALDEARRYLAAAAAPQQELSLAPQRAAAPPSRLEEEASREAARAASKGECKRERAAAAERLEDLVPRATGKDAKAAERAGRRELAKQRDASPDAHVTGGGDVMGGNDSFAAAVARQKALQSRRDGRSAQRDADLQQRAAAANAVEEQKMAAFRALVGGGGLSIARRE